MFPEDLAELFKINKRAVYSTKKIKGLSDRNWKTLLNVFIIFLI